MNDDVNNPSHYQGLRNKLGIDVLDLIDATGFGYKLGNVLKYILRHEYKGNPLQDLKKAAFYLSRVVAELEAKAACEEAKAACEEGEADPANAEQPGGRRQRVLDRNAEWKGIDRGFDTELYVSPSPERIAGDDDASARIKARYYEYDADEAIASCRNPACRSTIKSCDIPVVDYQGRHFCSLMCAQLVNRCV